MTPLRPCPLRHRRGRRSIAQWFINFGTARAAGRGQKPKNPAGGAQFDLLLPL
ncbi:hypothetical protein KCP78_18890 [Salmonella enterica subsp. enterica]|nr:hypothetical protein KCP78_18890 [Salmonella enterica subsp. enterica]